MNWHYSTGFVRERTAGRETDERAIELLEYIGIARYAYRRAPGV